MRSESESKSEKRCTRVHNTKEIKKIKNLSKKQEKEEFLMNRNKFNVAS